MARKSFVDGEILTQIDGLIRSGQVAAAKARLGSLTVKHLTRPQEPRVAQLMVRSGLFNKALALLAPRVRPETPGLVPATAMEKSVYAMALSKLGSVDEALELLATVDHELPEAHLYSAFAHQAHWNYPEALPRLARYLQMKSVTDYERAVASVNRLAGLIAVNDLNEADRLMNDLLAKTARAGWDLLRKNVQELSVQLAIKQQDWPSVRLRLKEAGGDSASSGVFSLFINKWQAIAGVLEEPSEKSLGRLLEVQSSAVQMSHWETVRDCDRIVAKVTQNGPLFDKLYFGTPYANYRAMLVADNADWARPSGEYLAGHFMGGVFDLSRACSDDGSVEYKPGQVVLSCLTVLLSDFYRPLSVGQLHSGIFPGAYFNPASSIKRVTNVVNRLRASFKKARWRSEIHMESQLYRLKIRGHAIRIRREVGGPQFCYAERLRSLGGEFSAREACGSLGLSKATVLRWLHSAVESGIVTRQGEGRATVYRLAA